MKNVSIVLLTSLFFLVHASFAQADIVDNFHTYLSGAEEVPPVSTNTSGSVEIIANNITSKLTYVLNVHNADQVTAAHLHCGVKGQNGPVVAFLFGKGGANVSGELTSSGSITSLEPTGAACPTPMTSVVQLVQAINDGKIYANVHSVSHPAGVIRGQMELKVQLPTVPQLPPGFPSIPGLNPEPPGDTNAFVEKVKTDNEKLMDQIKDQNKAILDGIFGSGI